MTIARSVARAVAGPVARSVVSGDSGSGTDPDAAAYFSAVEAAGGSFDLTSLDAAYTAAYVKAAHNTLFTQLKSNGLWSKITELYLLVGKTFDGITIKAKGTGLITSVNFVSGDYVAAGSGAGLKGNGSNKRIETGLAVPSFATVSSATIGIYGEDFESTLSGHFMIADAASQGSPHCAMIGEANNRTCAIGHVWKAAPDLTISVASTNPFASFDIITRTSSTDERLYRNGVQVSTTNTGLATGVPSGELGLFSLKYGTASPYTYSDYSDMRAKLAFAGSGLTATDAANLTDAINYFMYQLGAAVFVSPSIVQALNLHPDVETYANNVLAAGGNWSFVP